MTLDAVSKYINIYLYMYTHTYMHTYIHTYMKYLISLIYAALSFFLYIILCTPYCPRKFCDYFPLFIVRFDGFIGLCICHLQRQVSEGKAAFSNSNTRMPFAVLNCLYST
uniref:Uncharacterized protein n=1 Tax=Anguilla anguilla TaxID=7936 RepID=A0A0E9X9C5_ANGAN